MNTKIQELITDYFNGLYHGDASLLQSVFLSTAQLTGCVNGAYYFKNLNDYLEVVKNRKSPSDLQEPFAMKILSVEVEGKIASVKAKVPMLGYNYVDYLSLVYADDEWKIAHKTFTS